MLTVGRINFKALLIFISLLFLPLFLSSHAQVVVNINTANSSELQTLSGVGPAIAGRIIDYRISHGPFQKIEDIKNVSGIGDVTFLKMKDFITVGDAGVPEEQGGANETSTTTNTTIASETTSANTSTTLSAHYGSEELSSVKTGPGLEIGAGRARLGMVGTPIQFKSEIKYPYVGNMIFKWSFGDGAIGYGQVLSHSYAYPGDYVVVLNVTSPDKQAVSRTNVRIVPADISISAASQERVEVSNNSQNEINLFGRALSSQDHIFVFPEDTIVKAGQKISFASSITGLHPLDENNVSMIVVGDNLNKAFVSAVQVAENKKDNKQQIEVLLSKAQEIQKQLTTIPTESNLVVSPRNEQNTATAFVALNLISSSSTTTTQSFRRGWLQTIREFFLGKKQ